MLLHEDYPHTVTARAWLRWKENYFWVFMRCEETGEEGLANVEIGQLRDA